MNTNGTKLLVGGLHIGGGGYPNAQRTLEILKQNLNIEIIECGKWLPESMHLWRLSTAQWSTKLIALTKFFFGNLFSLIVVLYRQGEERIPVYIPYPGIFFLWWASWIPATFRPRCIADAYISIWDSIYRDRIIKKSNSFSEKILKSFESRALRTAEVVIVDTLKNKQMYIDELGINNKFIETLPLAINDDIFLKCPPKIKNKNSLINILFVGTLIPLHGIETILKAIEILILDNRFKFHILGDGQLRHLVENYSTKFDKERFTWTREWVDLPSIADAICKSDICLGVFGGNGKAARVLPFKIYMYLASGRSIVTQSDFSLPEAPPLPPPMLAVRATSALDVVSAIILLANDENLRNKLGEESKIYYLKYLGSDNLSKRWDELLSK